MKGSTVYISNPTWGNHRNIFGDENVPWKYYRRARSVVAGFSCAALPLCRPLAP